MDPVIVAAGLSALASVGGNIYSNSQNSRNVDKQNAFNLMMWNKMNEYNDPVKQVDRLKKAGINPALALSNINPGIAQGVTGANYQPVNNPMADIPNITANAVNQSMQSDIIKKQSEALDANIRYNNLQSLGLGKYIDKYLDKDKESQIVNRDADTAIKKQSVDNLKQVFENNKILMPLQNRLTEEQVNLVAKQAEKLAVDIKISEYDLNFLKPLEVQQMKANIANTYASIALTQSKVISENLTHDLIKANITRIYEDIRSIALQNKWSQATFNKRVEQVTATLLHTYKNTDFLTANIDYLDHKKAVDWSNVTVNGVNAAANVVKAAVPFM